MLSRAGAIFVITTFSMVASPVLRVVAAQEADPIVDPDAYAILSDVIPAAWASVSGGQLLLQRETTTDLMCSVVSTDPEWTMAVKDFHEQNARTRVLQEPMLSLKIPHRFIARAEIEADDARLALKYPGLWNRRPGSMDFLAVSAVGFNAAKTRAVVYLRLRDRGIFRFLERQEEKWVSAPFADCGWTA
jgi:hypothetical protein